MRKQNQIPSALKHGVYSGLTILPGEDADAFKQLHDDLITEFDPHGPLEEDIVETITRLTWRKQNLLTYRIAKRARSRYSGIKSELIPQCSWEASLASDDDRDPDEVQAAEQAAEEQARKELGQAWELIEIGKVAKTDHLLNELSIMDRLDGMIDRCLKRLLFVRGIKSLSGSSPPPAARKKLSAA
jgi:hypothetical protein